MTGIKTTEGGQGPGSQDNSEQQQVSRVGASGTGAASAFARMKSQHDHQARQRPADDSHPDGHRSNAR